MLNGATVIARNLGFVEGPRWHDGRLWFSDMRNKKVMTTTIDGQLETICDIPGDPSGLGWLPDGGLLIVSMRDRRLLRITSDNALTEVANLSALTVSYCNDMVVSRAGFAYVGEFGFDLGGWLRDSAAVPFRHANIVVVAPDGTARIAADGLAFPNGSVITPDGSTLIVAESRGARLTAFAIDADGSLSQRRIWATFDNRGVGMRPSDYLGRVRPDGICLDAEGAVWAASPGHYPAVLRVREGGEITHLLEGAIKPYACMLGGPDGRTLFVLGEALDNQKHPMPQPNGCILAFQVDVPHSGMP